MRRLLLNSLHFRLRADDQCPFRSKDLDTLFNNVNFQLKTQLKMNKSTTAHSMIE
jgi:hypothetical protein